MRTQLLQACPTLCNLVDCGLPSSSVYGILQAEILEWVAIFSSRGSSWPGIEPTSPESPASAGIFFTSELPGKPFICESMLISYLDSSEVFFQMHKTVILYLTYQMKRRLNEEIGKQASWLYLQIMKFWNFDPKITRSCHDSIGDKMECYQLGCELNEE